MELAKRTAHMTAALGGFKKVEPFEKVFPAKQKAPRSRDVASFFRRKINKA